MAYKKVKTTSNCQRQKKLSMILQAKTLKKSKTVTNKSIRLILLYRYNLKLPFKLKHLQSVVLLITHLPKVHLNNWLNNSKTTTASSLINSFRPIKCPCSKIGIHRLRRQLTIRMLSGFVQGISNHILQRRNL